MMPLGAADQYSAQITAEVFQRCRHHQILCLPMARSCPISDQQTCQHGMLLPVYLSDNASLLAFCAKAHGHVN